MRTMRIALIAMLAFALLGGDVVAQPPRHGPPPKTGHQRQPPPPIAPERRVLRDGDPVTVGVSNYYIEFANISDGEATGLAVEVLRRAADRTGLELRFVYVPTDEAWKRLIDGSVDVLAFQSVSERFFDDAIYGPPYVVTHGRIYTRPGTPPVREARDLRGKRVVIDGSLAKPWLAANAITGFISTNDIALAVEKLGAGEVDYYATTRLALRTSMRRTGKVLELDEHQTEGSTFYRSFASAFRPDRKELHGRLLKGIAEVMASPDYQSFYNSYAGGIEPTQVDTGIDRSLVFWAFGAAAVIIAGATTLVVSLRLRVRCQQRALAMSESRYRQLFEASEDAILVIAQSDGRVLDANPAATRVYGWTMDELRTMLITQITTDPGHAAECLEEVMAKGLARGYTCQHLTKDRGLIQIEATVAVVEAFGQTAFAIYLCDTTERVRAGARERAMESRLAQTQRLEGLALLAGGVAHDFNNLLMAISGNAELVRLRSKGDLRFEQPTSDIVRAARMATELTQQMLDTAGSTPVKSEPTNLTTVATDLIAALGPRLGTLTRVTLELDHDLPMLSLDAPRLRRILMNVLTNAADASHGRGNITIRTGRRQLEHAQLSIAAAGSTLPEGEYLVIEVEDTGEGMSEEVLARIFDPFFTTKPQGRGLGLSVMLGNVRRMGGVVLVRSKVGVGSCFTLAFPPMPAIVHTSAHQVHDAESRAILAPPASLAPAELGRALVVDDSLAVMGVTAAFLTDLGWDVTSSSSVESAVAELLRTDFRLVIADVVMPGGGGAAVLGATRESQPLAAVILMSGHAPEGSIGAGTPDALLQKPFGLRELEAAVQEALGAARARAQLLDLSHTLDAA